MGSREQLLQPLWTPIWTQASGEKDGIINQAGEMRQRTIEQRNPAGKYKCDRTRVAIYPCPLESRGPHWSVTAAGSGCGNALLDKFSTLRFGSESTPRGKILSLNVK
jgi:hypothetical protein